jgi:tetratricopeptide (TPR) repeat protein
LSKGNLVALCGALAAGCQGAGNVVRVVDGRAEQGRAVAEEAYAATLRAGIFDASGDRERALAELARALASDPDSPELLTRYGEVLCRPGRESPPRPGSALSACSRALNLDDKDAPAWLGRARCLTLLGRYKEALVAAELAAAGDPLDVRATELVARLLFDSGRKAEGWAWLDGLATLSPGSLEAQRAVLAVAVRERDAVRIHRARQALVLLGQRLPGASTEALAEAIAKRDLPAARRAALELRMSSSALSLELAKAAPELGLEQARFVLAADPTASDAWIAGLTAADALADHAHFDEVARALAPEPLPPSSAALALLGELLARHVGPDGGAAFARALGGTAQ